MPSTVANVPKASLLQAGGCVVGPKPGDPICAAYDSALDAWCKRPAGKRGDFNDVVFEHLGDPKLEATRERAVGFVPKGFDAGVGFKALGKQGGRMGEAGAALFKDFANATPVGESGFPAFVYRILGSGHARGKLGDAGVKVERVLFPDAVRQPPGRPLELKRPTEQESHPDQLRHYAEASPTGTCELVNCATCKLSCASRDEDCPPELYPSGGSA